MIYRNIDLHNIVEIEETPRGAQGYRVPRAVRERFELPIAKDMSMGSVGVEYRFVIRSGKATLRFATSSGAPLTQKVHCYYGGVQGGWMDERFVTGDGELTLERPADLEKLRRVAREAGSPWDPEVIRVVPSGGSILLAGVEGDVVPPRPDQVPKETLLCYGSSITACSNSLDQSHSWASLLARALGMDYRNLGMAGSCAMEPEYADWIAGMGTRDEWHTAVLELGVNVSDWSVEKIRARAGYLIRTVAEKNPTKTVCVVSPFYSAPDLDGSPNLPRWREELERLVGEIALPNLIYVNGLTCCGSSRYLCHDWWHPDIIGTQKIYERLSAILTERLGK